MLILSCDTSNSTCCAGVYEDGRELSYELSLEKRTHSETFMPLVERVIKASGKEYKDLDAIAVTTGPGSFTGIRIGLSAVKGLSYALSIPCIPVSSTAALALSVENVIDTAENTILVPSFDARNNRVFASVRGGDGYTVLIEEGAYDANDLAGEISKIDGISEKTVILLGDGSEVLGKALSEAGIKFESAGGCAILPKGITAAAKGIKPIGGEAVTATYCAVSSAERLRKQ